MPVSTRNAFKVRISNLLRDYDEMILAVHGKKRQASLETMLSEQAVMSLGVYWEAFVHELFVAYVIQNPVNCVLNFRRRLEQNLADKFNVPQRWLKLTIPPTINAKHAERMIDPKGWNINATSAQELRSKANQFLHSTHALNFSLNADDAAFVDFLVAVRNFLAHRSANSRALFKSSLASMHASGANAALASGFVDVGSYLKSSSGSSNQRRVNEIGSRLIVVADRLVP